jgi:hypothetical protein
LLSPLRKRESESRKVAIDDGDGQAFESAHALLEDLFHVITSLNEYCTNSFKKTTPLPPGSDLLDIRGERVQREIVESSVIISEHSPQECLSSEFSIPSHLYTVYIWTSQARTSSKFFSLCILNAS